jgi:hypothetical protein
MLGFLPMPHKVTIEKAGTLDDWGIAVAGQSQTVNARVSYNTRKESITVASGETIVFTAKVILEGLPEVDYEDYINFTDERGKSFKKQPLEVDYKFDLSGSAVAVSVVL